MKYKIIERNDGKFFVFEKSSFPLSLIDSWGSHYQDFDTEKEARDYVASIIERKESKLVKRIVEVIDD